MSDIISRQDAIKVLKEYEVEESDNFTRADPISMMTVATIANCIEAIVELPPVESERKKGEWNFIGDNMFKCTCCGVLYTTHQLNGLRNYNTDPYAPYFCPNCGANMRG